MFRATRTDHPNHILITIEGQLAGDYIEVAESACEEAFSAGSSIMVFLKNVNEIDSSGHALLRRLMLKGARIRANGIYLRHIVRSLQKSVRLNG
jgi:ABC-type transporter Mla MlaB component